MLPAFAPDVLRQRLLVEGYYRRDQVGEAEIREFFRAIIAALGVTAYAEPIIYSPGGDPRGGNQGYDAFVPLIDSGISLYVWTTRRFVSAVIYTCKSFSEETATQTLQSFFDLGEFRAQSF